MSNQLKDILKLAHDRLKGVHSAQTSAGSTGKDPGVDYKPKAGDEDEYVAKHSVEKWDDRYGNPDHSQNVKYSLDTPQNKRMGNDHEKSKKDYFVPEAKEVEETKCNMSEAGKMCEVHGMKDCSSMKKINELSTDLLHRAAHKAAKVAMTDVQGRSGPIFKKRAAQANKFRAKGMEQEKKEKAAKAMKEEALDEISKTTLGGYVQGAARDLATRQYNLGKGNKSDTSKIMNRRKGIDKAVDKLTKEEVIDEVLTKSTTAGETISDFVHSKNPKFAGKSKEKRKEMALAAYYAKQRNESIEETYAVQPLLGSTHGSSDIAKYKTDDTQDEIDMVRTELKAIANKTMHMLANMPANHHIEPWVQSKIAAAKEMIGSVHDYMMYSDDDEEDEQTDTPVTFPNMANDSAAGINV